MIFKIEENIFAPDVTEVDLSEKEIEYIAMMISGVKQPKIKHILPITNSELKKLYNKFGLTDKTKIRYMQIATIVGMNDLISEDTLLKVSKKYFLVECEEMIKVLKANSNNA